MEYTKETNVIFTQHILERFVERTMNKTGNELKQFIAQNEKQIKEKILKLYEYSEMFWYGKIKNHDLTYFLINRDGWVIIVDKDKKTLITTYKVDLGLGSEFNKQYVEEIKKYVEMELQQITKMKNEYDNINIKSKDNIATLRDNIKTLKAEITLIENQIKLIEDTQKVNLENINIKEKKLQQKMEQFIGAKIFEKAI